MTHYNSLTKPEQRGYDKGVTDCIEIMSELYDEYGDYQEASDMYFAFLKQLRQNKQKQKGE